MHDIYIGWQARLRNVHLCYPAYYTLKGNEVHKLRGKDFAMISLKVPTGTYKSM